MDNDTDQDMMEKVFDDICSIPNIEKYFKIKRQHSLEKSCDLLVIGDKSGALVNAVIAAHYGDLLNYFSQILEQS